jgi:hypothetical protein
MNIVPVDFAARAIVHASLQAEATGRSLHVANATTVSIRDAAAAAGRLGLDSRLVPWDAWLQSVSALAPDGGDGALRTLLALIGSQHGGGFAPRFAIDRMSRVLAAAGIVCPPPRGPVLEACILAASQIAGLR